MRKLIQQLIKETLLLLEYEADVQQKTSTSDKFDEDDAMALFRWTIDEDRPGIDTKLAWKNLSAGLNSEDDKKYVDVAKMYIMQIRQIRDRQPNSEEKVEEIISDRLFPLAELFGEKHVAPRSLRHNSDTDLPRTNPG